MTAPTVLKDPGRRDPGHQLAELACELTAARHFDIGYPGAIDLAFPELAELMTRHLVNNIGDPQIDGHGHNHTKRFEREVIDILADWLHAPAGHWGYVTSGASEGTEHALDEAWQAYPDIVAYGSAEAHYSVVKACRRQKLPLVQVAADQYGRMELADLEDQLRRRRERPAMIVATVGTTMTEASDDVEGIIALCERLAIFRRRIHVDAALAGIPLALLPPGQRPAFAFDAGATSIVVSGHKFLSTLQTCAVIIYGQSPYLRAGGAVPYTASLDTTLLGSRSGHTPLLLWLALTRLGADGHRARAETARKLAAYAVDALGGIGWRAWRNPHAFTVVLDPPPESVTAKWVVPGDRQRSHIITMPGISRVQVDGFVADLAAATGGPIPGRPAAENNGRAAS